MKIGVTTSIQPPDDLITRAHYIAGQFNCPVFKRKKDSLKKIMQKHALNYLWIVQNDMLRLMTEEEVLFWHPGTAVIKVWNMSQGKSNQLLDACRIEAGDRVLDCTLGYGFDAIVLASQVGDHGRVVGLESSPLLAFLTRDGLTHYSAVSDTVLTCMQKIDVIQADHVQYLKAQEASSFDVVYFDPMFQNPTDASTALRLIDTLADTRSLSREALDEALRVARKRVVIKEKIGSGVFKKLGVDKRVGNMRYGEIVYGVIEK